MTTRTDEKKKIQSACNKQNIGQCNLISKFSLYYRTLLFTFAATTSIMFHTNATFAADNSIGLYAIPYETGTRVHVTNDHDDHNPPNRIDMSGISGGPYRIVAAAHGIVRFVEDSHNANGSCANNNYVWIEHSNGEWTKYSHIAQHSASMDAGIAVGENVQAGQFIGIESDVGCASGDHLHFEVAVPNDPNDPIDPVGGYIKGINRIPRVCGVTSQLYQSGVNYTVPDVRPGYAEYARHGLAHTSYQTVFDAALNCNYQLDWVDGYDHNGSAYFNVIFHPQKSGLQWKSHRMLTAAQLEDRINDYVNTQGYSLIHIDAYSVGTAVRYAAIFNRSSRTLDTVTYHALDPIEHQLQFDTLVANGFRPRVISVASVNGLRTYAAVYTQGSIGSWQAKSFLTSTDYQNLFNQNIAAGRRLIYLNSYVHSGAPRYTAIWASSATPSLFAKHGLSSSSYQTLWEDLVSEGWRTGAVTAFSIDNKTSWAAYWRK